MGNRTLWLAEALTEVADALDTGLSDAGYANLMAARLSELTGPVEAGILLADDADSLSIRAAASQRVARVLAAETRLAEGPCTSGFAEGRELRDGHLPALTARWPRYCPEAIGAGYCTVTVLPIRRQDVVLGGVVFLGGEGEQLGDDEYLLAGVLARIAAIGILDRRGLNASAEKANQLQRALDSRVLIEQAKGALAARLGITPPAAFELLRGFARRKRTLLTDVADQVLAGVLVADDLRAANNTKTAQHSR
ncbi:GAF and ANTAR domain-containing protein [Saccharomonospora sp. NPDC006951]